MRYQVRFVADESLPTDTTWAFAQQAGQTYLFVRQSAIDWETGQCSALDDACGYWLADQLSALGASRSPAASSA